MVGANCVTLRCQWRLSSRPQDHRESNAIQKWPVPTFKQTRQSVGLKGCVRATAFASASWLMGRGGSTRTILYKSDRSHWVAKIMRVPLNQPITYGFVEECVWICSLESSFSSWGDLIVNYLNGCCLCHEMGWFPGTLVSTHPGNATNSTPSVPIAGVSPPMIGWFLTVYPLVIRHSYGIDGP